ncbi:MAG TPA: rhodanese-like domain-containing protein [Thermodesulfovibrionales bacterium]|nr:rhodanese-like domain-containing protein [Thermodesulfovibrionales bacterium]
MGISEYFTPLSTWSVQKAGEIFQDKNQEAYDLIDVRHPREYEAGHLPGAHLIPLDELPDRLGDLDREKLTITYCAKGMRSRAAAALLLGSGFREVHSIEGGLEAWHGPVAEGPPDSGMAYFSPAAKPEELIALAWLLEDGSRKFYHALSELFHNKEAAALFHELARAEGHHMSSLLTLYTQFIGKEADAGFPWSVLSLEPEGDIMEGGVHVDEALKWVQGKEVTNVLEFAIANETNSYDLYLRMERTIEGTDSKKVFGTLSGEEKLHLQRLIALSEHSL